MWEKGFVIENDKSGRNTIEKEMISYIQQNFMEKISLKEFSEQFHLSEKYISRYFKEHFHITLSQYITHLRLEHAKQLLQDTDIPVTEIAMQSGYQNVSYFIRSFKKTYGVSPLKYRKNKPGIWLERRGYPGRIRKSAGEISRMSMGNKNNGGKMQLYIRFIRKAFKIRMEMESVIFQELSADWII